jgi:phage terminase large subunit
MIVADSAEPKSIQELQTYGLNIIGAVKGADSINHGIQLLQGEVIKMTARSTNLIKEARNYSWDKDKFGNSVSKPIDTYNHCIDATRYVASSIIKKNVGKYRFA